MTYRFQPAAELYWGVVVAASLVLLQALFTLDPAQVVDWRVWGVALLGATVRAAAGAALDYLRRSMVDDRTRAPEQIIRAIDDLTPDEKDALAIMWNHRVAPGADHG